MTATTFGNETDRSAGGDFGPLQSLALNVDSEGIQLAGRDAVHQIIVTGTNQQGRVLDVTQRVQYAVTPAGIVEISASGYLLPLGEGTATVEVMGDGGGCPLC